MTVLKFALTTCAFYILFAALVQAALLGINYARPGVSFHVSRTGWVFFFGITWLASFICSYRVLMRLIDHTLFSN
jgi:hypothetical protein